MENTKLGKKKLYLITGAVIAVCAIIIAIVLTSKGDSTNKKLENQLNLGNSYMDELDYEAAIAAYEEAIRIEPKSEEAYIALANAYIEQGEYEKAIEVLDEGYAQTEAVTISDKKDEIVLILEEIEEAERQEELAAQATPTPVSTSIPTPIPTLVPTEPEVEPYQEKIDQAKQYIENGEYEAAIAELESAIELDATNELAYKELAQLYESQEDYEAALAVLDKGIENTDSEELVSYHEQIWQELERLNEIAEAERQAELATPTTVPTPTAQATETTVEGTGWTERVDNKFGGYDILEYDANGICVKATCYNFFGDFCGYKFYEYGANGNVVKATWYNADGTVYGVSEYDVNGNLMKDITYCADGRYMVDLYDADGNCLVTETYNADGTYWYLD